MDKPTIINNISKFTCSFCGLNENDKFRYGVKYKLGNIVAHYYCVLLSSKLIQRGKDEEGILGFLYEDIHDELNRTLNVLCFYCKQGKATIKCAFKNCRRHFHLPCGLKKGSLSQFIDNFKSYCHLHSPIQDIPKDIYQEATRGKLTCCICYENLRIGKKRRYLWAPCCQKSWYHVACIQKLAFSAGYFFKCPACNDDQKFNRHVQEFGVFIPQQDASWELVPHAFEELLFRYNKCDAKVCLCPYGRERNQENQKWEIIICDSCGSQGIHVACGGFRHSDEDWDCPECQEIVKSIKFSTGEREECKAEEESSDLLKVAEIRQKKRRRGSEDLENLVFSKRRKCKQDLQEEEIEIDVETVDGEAKDDKVKRANEEPKDTREILNKESIKTAKMDAQEVLTSIRPGPLSYKLRLIRKALKNSRSRPTSSIEKRKTTVSANVIVLTDSEDSDDDVKIILEIEKRTSEKHPSLISPEKANKVATDSSGNGSEKPCDLVPLSNDIAKARDQSSLSLDDFDILAAITLDNSGGQKISDCTVDGLYENTGRAAAVQDCRKNASVSHAMLFGSFPPHPGEEAFAKSTNFIHSGIKMDERLSQPVGDDVIILMN